MGAQLHNQAISQQLFDTLKTQKNCCMAKNAQRTKSLTAKESDWSIIDHVIESVFGKRATPIYSANANAALTYFSAGSPGFA
jgi:hypothetical protein